MTWTELCVARGMRAAMILIATQIGMRVNDSEPPVVREMLARRK